MENKAYIAIDLKSFYASVECVDRGLDPLEANLVVADKTRTEKTICLAVSPSLKAYGIPGRARLFEVIQRVKSINKYRLLHAPGGFFSGKSFLEPELKKNPSLELDYIVARPRMSRYMRVSSHVYETYLRFVAPEDIHVYSIDEVFIDAAPYLRMYGLTAGEFAMSLVKEVLKETGVTATAGIGTNLYLSKVAMDIVAKHIPPDSNGVRIAELDERAYREGLWSHRPITDFWRVGRGYAGRLASASMYTMGDVARCSVYNEEKLYRLFGVNAELLIDHAWGYESCTIEEIKAYRPETNSVSSSQVLKTPYSFENARLVMREMADILSLDLVRRRAVTDRIVISVGYDISNLTDPARREAYKGPVRFDHYGRLVPERSHGSVGLERKTASSRLITGAVTELFDRITDRTLLVRRLSVAADNVVPDSLCSGNEEPKQLSLFEDFGEAGEVFRKKEAALDREKREQRAVLEIKERYGKNAIIKGMNLQENATAVERNLQVGGHRA